MFQKFKLLVRLMMHEEWRMHNTLFDGSRFAFLPVVFMGLAGLAAGTMTILGVSFPVLCGGVIALAGLLGLQTGTLGFESRDGMDNVLGEATFLLFSSRTLPLSARTTVAAFLLKDMFYYAVLFIAPLVVGTYAGVQLASLLLLSSGAALPLGSSGILIANTWLASTLVFLMGVSIVLVASGELARNLRLGGLVLMAAVAGVFIGVDSIPDLAVMPLAALVTPPLSALQLAAIGGVTLLLSLIGILRFSPTGSDGTTQPRAAFGWLRSQLGDSQRATLAAKMVTDVHRSSGGVGKLLVSSAIILVAVYAILEVIQQWMPLNMSPGVVFSAILSVSAVPTYIWLTQLDDVETYEFYPVSIRDLFAAKAVAFVLLEIPVALAYYAAVVILLQPTALDLGVGSAILFGSLTYLFGITVYLTGFTPNESLFDSVVFLQFSLLGMVVLLPFLIVGLFIPTLTGPLAGGLVTISGFVGLLGLVAYRRGARKWSNRLNPVQQ